MSNTALLRSLNISISAIPVEARKIPSFDKLSDEEVWALCVISNMPAVSATQMELLNELSGVSVEILEGLKLGLVLPDTDIKALIAALGGLFTRVLGEKAQKLLGGNQNVLKDIYTCPTQQLSVSSIPQEIFECLNLDKPSLENWVASTLEVYPEKIVDQLKKLKPSQIQQLTSGVYNMKNIEAHLRGSILAVTGGVMVGPQPPGEPGEGGLPCLTDGYDTLIKTSTIDEKCNMVLGNHPILFFDLTLGGAWVPVPVPDWDCGASGTGATFARQFGGSLADYLLAHDGTDCSTNAHHASSLTFCPYDDTLILTGMTDIDIGGGTMQMLGCIIKVDRHGVVRWEYKLFTDYTTYYSAGTSIAQPYVRSDGVIVFATVVGAREGGGAHGCRLDVVALDPDGNRLTGSYLYPGTSWLTHPTTHPDTEIVPAGDMTDYSWGRPCICPHPVSGYLLFGNQVNGSDYWENYLWRLNRYLRPDKSGPPDNVLVNCWGYSGATYTGAAAGRSAEIAPWSGGSRGVWLWGEEPRVALVFHFDAAMVLSKLVKLYSPDSGNPAVAWRCNGAKTMNDESLIMWGRYWYPVGPATFKRACLTKLDDAGALLWTNTYDDPVPGADRGEFYSACEAGDGTGHIFVYGVFYQGDGDYVPKVARLDENGEVLWARAIPRTGDEPWYSLPLHPVGELASDKEGNVYLMAQSYDTPPPNRPDFLVIKIPYDGQVSDICPFFTATVFDKMLFDLPPDLTVETDDEIGEFWYTYPPDPPTYYGNERLPYHYLLGEMADNIVYQEIDDFDSKDHCLDDCSYDCQCENTDVILGDWSFGYGWYCTGDCAAEETWATHGYCGEWIGGTCVDHFTDPPGDDPLEVHVAGLLPNRLYKLTFTYTGEARAGYGCAATLTPWLGGTEGDTITFNCVPPTVHTTVQYIRAGESNTKLQFFPSEDFIGAVLLIQLELAANVGGGSVHEVEEADRGHVFLVRRDPAETLIKTLDILLPEAETLGNGYYFYVRTLEGVTAVVHPYTALPPGTRKDTLLPLGGTAAPGDVFELGENSGMLIINATDDSLPDDSPQVWYVMSVALEGSGGPSLDPYLWSSLRSPTNNLLLLMESFTTQFVWGGATGTSDLFRLRATAGNVGTGTLLHVGTSSSSALKPLYVAAQGTPMLALKSDGSIGVGTSMPLAQLHVKGVDNEVQCVVQGYSTQSDPLQRWINASSNVTLEVEGDGALRFIAIAAPSAPVSDNVKMFTTYTGVSPTKYVTFEVMFQSGERAVITDFYI